MLNFYAKTAFCLRCWEVSENSVTRKNPFGHHISLDSEPQSRWSSPLTFMTALQPSLYTNPVYRKYICKCCQKSGAKRRRFYFKSATSNEPHLGGHNVEKKYWQKIKCPRLGRRPGKIFEFALQIQIFTGLRPRGGQIKNYENSWYI